MSGLPTERRISVALCTYNGRRFLAEQLQSIARQSRLPDELVIIDDCSEDGTVAVLEAFARRSPFPVRIHRNPENVGSTKSFERVIGRCQGELIALCDQDDRWLPRKLERLERALVSEPDAGYVFSDARIVDEKLQSLSFNMWETVNFGAEQQRAFSGARQIDVLLERTIVTGATLMFKARFIVAILPIPASAVHDAWIATLLSAIGAYGVFVAEPLVDYRQHAGQQIGVADQVKKWRWPPRAFIAHRRILLEQRLASSKVLCGRISRLKSPSLDSHHRQQGLKISNAMTSQIDHFMQRCTLESLGRSDSIRAIARELYAGNYQRFSGGVNAALLDLAYCLLRIRS